eukprot:365847-Chlamydomonas_euryale.AAC.17
MCCRCVWVQHNKNNNHLLTPASCPPLFDLSTAHLLQTHLLCSPPRPAPCMAFVLGRTHSASVAMEGIRGCMRRRAVAGRRLRPGATTGQRES